MKLKLLYSLLAATMLFFQTRAQQTAQVTSNGIAYLEYLPQGYNTNSNKYPLIISLHGIKEKGTTSTVTADLLASVQIVANVGLAKYIKYGQHYNAIVISPQLKSNYGSWPADYVVQVLNYVKTKLRVDESRVSITGLSLGGGGVVNTISAYPQLFSAAAIMCPANNNLSRACAMAAESLPLWFFHGDADAVVHYNVSVNMVNAVNACIPQPNPMAKLTIYPGVGHVVWDIAYKQTNVMDWMISATNGGVSNPPPPTNTAPIANAGADQNRTLPANSAVFYGSGSDTNGSISSYAWTQISGPTTATLANQWSAALTASNLIAGTYTFQLKVTDNAGATGTDNVSVVVNAATTTNTPPTVSAGADKTLTLPSNAVTINGSASDADGVSSYTWTKKSGGTAYLSGTTTQNLGVSGLAAGSYVFTLTATDSKGAASSDDVIVTVNSSTTGTNSLPIANAGGDRLVPLPSSGVTIYGSASDANGTIASYAWTKIAGPGCSLVDANKSAMKVTGLVSGNYTFRLTVTDNQGGTDTDDVIIYVSASPTVNAGTDRTISTTSVTLSGTASDPDGTIVQRTWSKQSGPATGSLVNASTNSVTVNGLVSGTYVFKFAAKDNAGLTSYDYVTVVVSGSTASISGSGSSLETLVAYNSVQESR